MLGDVTTSNGIDWSLDGRLDVLRRHRDAAHRHLRLRSGARRHLQPQAVCHDTVVGRQTRRSHRGATKAACGWRCGAAGRCGATCRTARSIRTIEVPAPHPTKCAFGGRDLTDFTLRPRPSPSRPSSGLKLRRQDISLVPAGCQGPGADTVQGMTRSRSTFEVTDPSRLGAG